MPDTQFWIKEWEETWRASSLYKRPNNQDKWEAFWDLYAESYAERNRRTSDFHTAVIEHLNEHGYLNEDSTVLDIGCGPGTYTLPLARFCKHVTALDTASQMLATLKNEANRCELSTKIQTTRTGWDQVPAKKRYDLVFAAKTPAIRDYQSLMKMEAVSRRFCCLITFVGGYASGVRAGLWPRVMGDVLKSNSFDMQYPFNILYQEGRLPNVAIFSYDRVMEESAEYLKKHYRAYFSVFGKQGPEVDKVIDEHIDAHSRDGLVPDHQKGDIGVIFWKVPEESS